jgi:hypothetical protein
LVLAFADGLCVYLNNKLKLPSADGYNTVILNGTLNA